MVYRRLDDESVKPGEQTGGAGGTEQDAAASTVTARETADEATPTKPTSHQRGSRRRRVARKTVATLPTLLTLGNLLCGFAAIFAASRNVDPDVLPLDWTPLTFAAIFIFLGMGFDSLDGGVARLTRSASDLGAQLDSMADMVTFGVAPAFLAVQLVGVSVPFISQLESSDATFDRTAVIVASIYAVCAALRLARFNIELEGDDEEGDHASFKGLPSPGAAGTVASLILLHQHFLAHFPEMHWSVELAKIGMVGVMLLAALAMVSAFRYVHVVNRYMRGRVPVSSLAHAVIVALLLVIYPQAALAGVFVIYALSAPVAAMYRWIRRASVE